MIELGHGLSDITEAAYHLEVVNCRLSEVAGESVMLKFSEVNWGKYCIATVVGEKWKIVIENEFENIVAATDSIGIIISKIEDKRGGFKSISEALGV